MKARTLGKKNDLEQKFLEAYELYAEPIYRHCFFRVYSAERAEDLVQETFKNTWDYLGQGKTIDNFRAFLYRVANNLIIDYSRKRQEESLDALLEQPSGWEPAETQDRSPEHIVLLRQIIDSLNKLPEQERTLLTLRYVDDLDPKDIAQILGISSNYTSVKINRALQLLKRLHADNSNNTID